jgi:hypothetical protein
MTAKCFIGRCQLCEHACRPSETRRKLDAMAFVATPLLCTEHPESPGKLREVMPTDTCRNFRQVRVEKLRVQRKENVDVRTVDWSAPEYKCYEKCCRIKLSGDYFVIVDPEDFEELSQYKWSASNKRGMVYAVRRKNGRTVYMHREIMKAPKGYVVDHRNCRIWDNRRCNLRVCTQGQNQVNRGPRGAQSRFVGVLRRGDKWEARISYRGKLFCLGRFDDPVEAAKARDRKAWELHGEFAYLNFPEDYGR